MSRSLYERLGGASGIAALVDDIVEAHMNNATIKARFVPYRDDAKKLGEVKRHLRDFLGMGSGGPERYAGRSMPDAHRGMNVSAQEYMAALDDILGTLDRHGIDEDTRKDVLAIAYSLKTRSFTPEPHGDRRRQPMRPAPWPAFDWAPRR